jgi:hypothetical protein
MTLATTTPVFEGFEVRKTSWQTAEVESVRFTPEIHSQVADDVADSLPFAKRHVDAENLAKLLGVLATTEVERGFRDEEVLDLAA